MNRKREETFDYAIFRWVMEQFLAEFGLVETRRVRDEGRWGGKQFVRKTAFFDQVLITW